MIKAGRYKITWIHYGEKSDRILKGTECRVAIDDVDAFSGHAILSDKDQFCKEKGRKVSLRRAIFGLPKEHRKDIWTAYFNRKENITNLNK